MIPKDHLPDIPGYQHHWTYIDHGMPVMVIGKYEIAGKKSYRQFCLSDNEWIEGTCPSPYPLFGLQTLKSPSPFNALIITEGEKCASALHHLGWPAITSVLGAQNPSNSDWKPVRYYNRFLILRDNDKAGVSFTRLVSTELRRIVPDAEILVANLAPEIPSGDVVEWLQSTVLTGQNWDGLQPIPTNMIEPVQKGLMQEITKRLIKVEDCPEVDFKPIEALFEHPPRKLKVDLLPVPPFPVHVFPEKIGEFLRLTSLQFSQIADYSATTLIASIGGLIGRSVHLRMRANDTWYETSNCWSALVGPPSAKKSPIMRRIFRLFKSLDTQAAQEFTAAKKAYSNRKRESEKGSEDFDELPPIRRRYITDDVTTPKLRELMAGNPRGILLRNDELKGQLERLDKHGSEGDRSFIMSCWSGLEEYSEDRMCRESLLNIPLALTWIGCIPPTALQRYLQEAMSRSSGADGFMQRFQFVCYPNHKQLFELSHEAIPTQLEADIQRIWIQIDEEAGLKNRILTFSSEAQVKFDTWLIKHENDTRFGNHPAYWESHLGKQAKALAVLVITLHRLNESETDLIQNQVSTFTLKAALEILAYFESHARRCYESVVGGTVGDAETILSLLRQKRLPPRFKAQDIYHQGLGGLSDSIRVRAALEMLQDYSWVVSEKVPGQTGRQSEFWNLHPRAFR